MKHYLGRLALALYVLSLLLPALVIESRPLFGGGPHTEVMSGAQCVLIGFFLWPGWLANPLLAVVLIIRLLATRAGWLTFATWLCVLALLSTVFAAFLLDSLEDPKLHYLHVGYFVWVAAVVTALVDTHLASLDRRERSEVGSMN